MTLDQIDQALAAWQTRLALAGDNLVELDGNAAYQRVRGSANRPAAALTGATQAQVGPALAVIDSLWESLQKLTEIVKQAQSLRPALGKLWAHDTEHRQIEFLLFGPSIALPTPSTPFAQRGLLSGAAPAQGMTPEQLLGHMTQDFTRVKDAVLTLDTAWNRLALSLVSADRDVASLQALAADLGAGAQPELDAALREIASLHDRVSTDPLGVSADLGSNLTTLIERTRARLNALKLERDRLDADLKRARALLLEVQGLEPRCRAVQAEWLAKIDAPLPVLPAVPADLAGWLQSVETARRQQQWKPSRIGLDRWLKSAQSVRASLGEFSAVCTAALERREELRGLLRALQAKAAAQAAHGAAVDAALPVLAREAEQLLHGRPTPLEQAAGLVADYERRLAGKG